MPVPGIRSPRRVGENTRAAGITFTEADLAAIGDILPGGGLLGLPVIAGRVAGTTGTASRFALAAQGRQCS